MPFNAGTLKITTKTLSNRIRSTFTSFNEVSNSGLQQIPKRQPFRSLSNFPPVDVPPALSPLDISEFGDRKESPAAYTEEQTPAALWSSHVGDLTPSDAPLSPVGFSCELTSKKSGSIISPKLSRSDSLDILLPDVLGADHPSLTVESSPLTDDSPLLHNDASVDGTDLTSRNTIPVFLANRPTAHTYPHASVCIFGCNDILGLHEPVSGEHGFFYCDPGAVHELSQLRSAVQGDSIYPRSTSEHPIHLFYELSSDSTRDMPDANPLVCYLGLYYVRFPLHQCYLSSGDWNTLPISVRDHLILRYSHLEIPGVGFLSQSAADHLYNSGRHVPLIEISRSPFPTQHKRVLPELIVTPPSHEDIHWVKSSHHPPLSLSECIDIPGPVISFLQHCDSPVLPSDPSSQAQFNHDRQVAGDVVKRLKLEDPQMHDRCLSLVMKYAAHKCDISAFISDF